MANLFESVKLGSLVLANRVFMAPLTRNLIGPLILAVTVALLNFVREEERAGNWSLQLASQPEKEIANRMTLTHRPK